jgi:hypothetical protein
MLEVRVDHPVGEALAANTDAFKHTVASKLVHDQVGVDDTCSRHKVKRQSLLTRMNYKISQ